MAKLVNGIGRVTKFVWAHRIITGPTAAWWISLAFFFACLFREIGDYRFPLNSDPTVASQFFGNWCILTDLRIPNNKWPMESTDVARREYFEVAPRNVSRARVRLSLEKPRTHSGGEKSRTHVAPEEILLLSPWAMD